MMALILWSNMLSCFLILLATVSQSAAVPPPPAEVNCASTIEDGSVTLKAFIYDPANPEAEIIVRYAVELRSLIEEFPMVVDLNVLFDEDEPYSVVTYNNIVSGVTYNISAYSVNDQGERSVESNYTVCSTILSEVDVTSVRAIDDTIVVSWSTSANSYCDGFELDCSCEQTHALPCTPHQSVFLPPTAREGTCNNLLRGAFYETTVRKVLNDSEPVAFVAVNDIVTVPLAPATQDMSLIASLDGDPNLLTFTTLYPTDTSGCSFIHVELSSVNGTTNYPPLPCQASVTLNLTGLLPDTEYWAAAYVVVRYVDNIGAVHQGQSAVTNVQGTTYTVPDIVKSMEYTDKNLDSLNITWELPDERSNIMHFILSMLTTDDQEQCRQKVTITCTPGVSNICPQAPKPEACNPGEQCDSCTEVECGCTADTMFYQVGHLNGNTSYDVSIHSRNPGGDSKNFRKIMTTIIEPPPPSEVSCASEIINDKVILKAFIYPPENLASQDITRYEIQMKSLIMQFNTSFNSEVPFEDEYSVLTYNDAVSGVTYNVSAFSVNNMQERSIEPNYTICSTILSEVNVTSVTSIGDTIEVKWLPLTNSYCDGFELDCKCEQSYCQAMPCTTHKTVWLPSTATQGTCSKLLRGTLYETTVRKVLNNSHPVAFVAVNDIVTDPLEPDAGEMSLLPPSIPNHNGLVFRMNYPTDQSGCDNIEVTVNSTKGHQVKTFPCSSFSMAEFIKLVPDTEYEASARVTVIYVNNIGVSYEGQSLFVKASQTAYTVPAPVTDLTYDRYSGPYALNISWRPPQEHSNIQRYTITLVEENNGDCVQNITINCVNKVDTSCDTTIPSPLCGKQDICHLCPQAFCNCDASTIYYYAGDLKILTRYYVQIYSTNPGGNSGENLALWTTSASSRQKPFNYQLLMCLCSIEYIFMKIFSN